jgi:hypothetical protein
MRESSTALASASNSSVERSCRFGTIVRALWPAKPALNLAQRIHSSERAAQFYIDGQRKVSARCVQAIVNEIVPVD